MNDKSYLPGQSIFANCRGCNAGPDDRLQWRPGIVIRRMSPYAENVYLIEFPDCSRAQVRGSDISINKADPNV